MSFARIRENFDSFNYAWKQMLHFCFLHKPAGFGLQINSKDELYQNFEEKWAKSNSKGRRNSCQVNLCGTAENEEIEKTQ